MVATHLSFPLVTYHCGPPADAEKDLRLLKQFEPPVLDAVAPISYSQLNAMLDANYPKRRSQLLEIEFPHRAERRCNRHHDRLLWAMPHAHGAATPRAYSRRGGPGRRQRDGVPAPEGRLQLPRARTVDAAGRHQRMHRLGARNLREDAALLRRRPLRQLSG